MGLRNFSAGSMGVQKPLRRIDGCPETSAASVSAACATLASLCKVRSSSVCSTWPRRTHSSTSTFKAVTLWPESSTPSSISSHAPLKPSSTVKRRSTVGQKGLDWVAVCRQRADGGGREALAPICSLGHFEKPTARADSGVPCSESLTRLHVRCGSCARCALLSTRSFKVFQTAL